MDKRSEIYLKKAVKQSLGSCCQRAKTGAVLVKDGQVLVEAFNRIFPENDFCQKNGCLRDKLRLGLGREAEKCRSIHAEALAITKAAQDGVEVQGAQAFITCQPCINCAKLLYSAGIKEVYFLDRHADETGKVFLEKMGVICKQVFLKNDDVKRRLRDTTLQEK